MIMYVRASYQRAKVWTVACQDGRKNIDSEENGKGKPQKRKASASAKPRGRRMSTVTISNGESAYWLTY